MVCDGCWVQGNGPHQCRQVTKLVNGELKCICKVEPECASWEPAPPVIRW
jgi:hypothetical protein